MVPTKMASSSGECFVYVVKIGTKLGQNLSEIEVRTFARIKKVIWDQLLATKAEVIKGTLYILLRVKISNAKFWNKLRLELQSVIFCRL